MALSPRRQAFQVDEFFRGLDHQRTQWQVAYGDWVASSTTTFMSGQLVALDSSGNVVLCTGSGRVLGVAKESKATAFYAIQADERIQLNGVVATTLDHPNVWAPTAGTGGLTVATAVSGGGTTYTEGGGDDYTVNYTNGTVVRTGGSTIVDGSYVYVTYRYLVSAAELMRDGSSFWNKDDEVSMQNDKVTVIEGPAKIYTAHFDPADQYAINDELLASDVAGCLGLVTKSGTGSVVGRVIQLPTASDPFLGYELYATAKIS
jgi:hypothetical protein